MGFFVIPHSTSFAWQRALFYSRNYCAPATHGAVPIPLFAIVVPELSAAAAAAAADQLTVGTSTASVREEEEEDKNNQTYLGESTVPRGKERRADIAAWSRFLRGNRSARPVITCLAALAPARASG